MTETAKRPTWIRTTAIVAVIALVVGVTGGWLLYAVSGPETPASVWLLRAESAALVQGDDGSVLTLTGVGQNVVEFDTNAESITHTADAAEFFSGWTQWFGGAGQRAVVTGVADGEQVQFSLEIADSAWDAGTATLEVSDIDGVDEFERLTDVVVAIDGA